MRTLRWFSALAVLALTAACGGQAGNCSSTFTADCSSGGPPPIPVATVLLVSDTMTIPSDNTQVATLTAYVTDASNNVMSGVPVTFKPSSGHVAVTQGTTDVNGAAIATLNTLGDQTNRTITVTATANGVVGTANIDVTGTQLQLSGANALTIGQTATYTVALQNSGSTGIVNIPITVTAPANMTVSATTVTTDAQGNASFTATATSGGTGVISVAGLGLTDSVSVGVNSDLLTFTTPAAGTTIPLNAAKTFTVHWSQNGVGVANQKIDFSTTRGCINPAGTDCTGQSPTATVTTNGSGDATISVLSDNAGGGTIIATTQQNQLTASDAVQFIATVAASIDVQPSLFVVAANNPPSTTEQSNIIAVVRDANNNLVYNATVVFSLNDITGGTLSVAAAKTDFEGRAQTVYTSGSVTSASGGVTITASVQGTAINKSVGLTVAARQVFISIGTGNEISEPNPAQYSVPYVIQVTDSTGAGVKGVTLGMSVLSQRYFKGVRLKGLTTWSTCYTIPQDVTNCIVGTPPSASVTMGCADEDLNRNGVLDPGENKNGNNPATVSPSFPNGYPTLEAGNIAAVSATTTGSLTTDDSGFAFATVYYPQEYAYYLQVTLQAQASVTGTAYFASSTFLLPGSSQDFTDLSNAPPGIVSPFGQSNTCSDMQ